MIPILEKLDNIEQLLTPKYRGRPITTGSNYFIASDNDGWVPANELQVKAFEHFLKQEYDNKIYVDSKNYFVIRHIGHGRYAIQDRTEPKVYREIQHLVGGTILTEEEFDALMVATSRPS